MKTVLVIFLLFATHNASASFFHDFHNALITLKSSFNKILSNVIAEVKHTLDCTVLTVEHVLALNEEGEAEYRRNCEQKSTPATHHLKHVNHGSDHNTQKIPLRHKSSPPEKETSEKVKKEVRKSIDESLCESSDHEKTKLHLESLKEILMQKHDRLSDVNAILREEIEKISGDMKSKYVKHLSNKNAKLSVDSVYDEMLTLQKVEENDKNATEIAEIDHVFDEIRQMLDMAQNGELLPDINVIHRTRKSSETDETSEETPVEHDFVTMTQSVTVSPGPELFKLDSTLHDSLVSSTSKPQNLTELKKYTTNIQFENMKKVNMSHENVAVLSKTHTKSPISGPVIEISTLSREVKNYVNENIRIVTSKQKVLNATEVDSVAYEIAIPTETAISSNATIVPSVDEATITTTVADINKIKISSTASGIDQSYNATTATNNEEPHTAISVSVESETILSTTAPSIDEANIASTLSDIDDTTIVTTVSDNDETSIATVVSGSDKGSTTSTVSEIDEATTTSTVSDIDKTTIATTISDIDEATTTNNVSDIAETTIATTESDIDEATIVTTVSNIDEATTARTVSGIDEATIVTTVSGIDEATIATSVLGIEATTASIVSDIDEATIATIVLNIDEAATARTVSGIDEATTATIVSDIDEATIVTTVSNIDEATTATIVSDINEATIATIFSDIAETKISSTVTNIDEATIATTVSDIDETTTSSTVSDVDESYYATIASSTETTIIATTLPNINKTRISSTVSDMDEFYDAITPTNIEKASIANTVTGVNETFFSSTLSDIDESYNASTVTNIVEDTISTTVSEINETIFPSTTSNLYQSYNTAITTNIEDVSIENTVSEVNEIFFAGTMSDMDQSFDATTASNIEEDTITAEVSEVNKTIFYSTLSDINESYNATSVNYIEATSIANTVSDINKTTISSRVSDIKQSYDTTPASNIDKPTIAHTALDIDETTISSTVSEIDIFSTATTSSSIDYTTIATPISDIDETTISIMTSYIDESYNSTIASNAEKFITAATKSDIFEPTSESDVNNVTNNGYIDEIITKSHTRAVTDELVVRDDTYLSTKSFSDKILADVTSTAANVKEFTSDSEYSHDNMFDLSKLTAESDIIEVKKDVMEATSRPSFIEVTVEPQFIKVTTEMDVGEVSTESNFIRGTSLTNTSEATPKMGDLIVTTKPKLSGFTSETNKRKVNRDQDVSQVATVKDTEDVVIATTESVVSQVTPPTTYSGFSEVARNITTESYLKEINTESHVHIKNIAAEETNGAQLLNKEEYRLPNRKNDEGIQDARNHPKTADVINETGKVQPDIAKNAHNEWKDTQVETVTEQRHSLEILKQKIKSYPYTAENNNSNFTEHIAVTSATMPSPTLIKIADDNEQSTLNVPESTTVTQIPRPHRRKHKSSTHNGTRRTRHRRRKHKHTTTDKPKSEIQPINMKKTKQSSENSASVSARPAKRLIIRDTSNYAPLTITPGGTSPKPSPIIKETLINREHFPKTNLPFATNENSGHIIDALKPLTYPQSHSAQFKSTKRQETLVNLATTKHPKLEAATISPDYASLFNGDYGKSIQPQLSKDTQNLLKRYKYSQVVINSLFNNPTNLPTIPVTDLFE